MDALQWFAEIGTNQLIKDIWTNNWITLSLIGAPIGAFIKGRFPDYWSKLSTMVPFIGSPKIKG